MGIEILFVSQLCVGFLMIIFLQKITQIKNQLDQITKEVENYITYLTEEVECEEIERRKVNRTTEMDASKSHLIQSVLQEFFP